MRPTAVAFALLLRIRDPRSGYGKESISHHMPRALGVFDAIEHRLHQLPVPDQQIHQRFGVSLGDDLQPLIGRHLNSGPALRG